MSARFSKTTVTGVSLLHGRGYYRIPMESPVRPRRTQARSLVLPCGHNPRDTLVRSVPFLLGACSKVLLCAHPRQR